MVASLHASAQPSLRVNQNAAMTQIDVVGVKSIDGVICLPDFFPLQDFDPMRPKSVDTYDIPEFDETVFVGPSAVLDDDVVELLNSLSLEDKIGQMTQAHISYFIGCDGLINKTAVEYASSVLRMGSVFDSPSDFVGRWGNNSPQRFANFTNTIQEIATSLGSKIPYIYGLDSVRGANFVKGATIFPTAVNTAATFNPANAYNAGRITAKDTRAAGVHWAFGPLADLNHQKLWSRNFENFGEDPYLSSQMVHNSVKGLQGNYKQDRSRVASTFKHFIGYSMPINGKDQEARYIPMNYLMEYFVPAFKAAIQAGAATGMEDYGALNGQDTVASNKILVDLLRNHLQFNGTLVTDANEMFSMFLKHNTAFSFEDSSYQVLNQSSVDISMSLQPENFFYSAIDLVNTGKIPISRVDESVGRIIQLKKDLGLFENPYSDPALIDTVGSAQDVEMSRDTARESIILLKNENEVLPLSKSEKVLYVGANFNSTRYLAGGWNVHWQGPNDYEGDAVYDGYGDTIMLGVQSLTNTTVNWIPGYTIDGLRGVGYETIVREARKADKVVFCFGEKTSTEVPGNINTLRMADDQYDIVKRVAYETATPIILLLAQNRPFSLGELSSLADGIVNANLPGTYGGLPVAEALFGVFSPSGRQPYSYPKLDYQAAVTYFTPIWNEYDPEFAFGQGMGYNQITYSNITVSSASLRPGSPVEVSVTATNGGSMAQNEPVLMFTTQTIRRGYSPEKYRLRAFDKQIIQPGSSRTFTFTLTAEEMMFWNVDLDQVLEEGPVDITINAFNENSVVSSIYLYTS
ncbi:Lysosomal beta glucosidase [Smittium mucronatum]|uniref:beta-glucosidase n=1 Tax=Smittium mucronatum TaxID=133383 RepID=A0A1R0GSG6_9FUNG|nr:Lysosomal beta glucosidase [Smittium mucronatum]